MTLTLAESNLGKLQECYLMITLEHFSFLCLFLLSEIYSELSETSWMEFLLKVVNYFRKKIHLRFLTGF